MKLPQNLITNLITIYGTQAEIWLENLPNLLSQLSEKWSLSNVKLMDNLSYNVVAHCYSAQLNKNVVLKVGIPSKEFSNELNALEYFDGNGCVQLLEHDIKNGVLLLQCIEPGTTLKTYFPEKDDQAVEIAVHVMKQLHRQPIKTAAQFPTIQEWYKLFNTIKAPQEFQTHLERARTLAKKLETTQKNLYLLHGDLHHDNILFDASSNAWLAIDPKGVIGEQSYEIGAFMCNPLVPLSQEITNRRLDEFSQLLHINRKRLAECAYVRIILSVCWSREDGFDIPENDLLCAEYILPSIF